MVIYFGKVKENTSYSRDFFAFLPIINRGRIYWLSMVNKEVWINPKTKEKTVTYGQSYDGRIYFSSHPNHSVVNLGFLDFMFFNKFVVCFNLF